MAEIFTAEEAKQRNIVAMGDPLGEFYDALWQEVAWLHTNWSEYVTLFGTKPSRVELLNQAAPRFFRTVQDSLWEGTILHIARLTDAPRSVGKANLSLKALPDLIDDVETKASIDVLVAAAIDASAFCRDWRNRRLAHRDLALAIDATAQPLQPASRLKVRTALDAIAAVLNAVSAHYLDSEMFFGAERGPGDAEALLYIIDGGLQAEAERREKLGRGDLHELSFKARDL